MASVCILLRGILVARIFIYPFVRFFVCGSTAASSWGRHRGAVIAGPSSRGRHRGAAIAPPRMSTSSCSCGCSCCTLSINAWCRTVNRSVSAYASRSPLWRARALRRRMWVSVLESACSFPVGGVALLCAHLRAGNSVALQALLSSRRGAGEVQGGASAPPAGEEAAAMEVIVLPTLFAPVSLREHCPR
jgi:hypothetical protein